MTPVSRRRFVQAVSAAGAALALPNVSSAAVGAPHRVEVYGRNGALNAKMLNDPGTPANEGLEISSTIAMASGVPLGGIGTGFIELRPDGCFYKWLIFNTGLWAGNLPAGQQGNNPDMGPQSLQFLIRTQEQAADGPALRRLYLRPHENNLYSLAYAQDVESIRYDAWFPMTSLQYKDSTLPVRVSAVAFSPFFPGNARQSATPGFNMVFTLENTSNKPVEVSLLSLLDNPLATGHKQRKLFNTIRQTGGTTTLDMNTKVNAENKTTLGSMCMSVSGGKHSWISGTFAQYAGTTGLCNWQTPRLNYMLVDVLQKFFASGKLPDTSGATDPAQEFKLTPQQIDALTAAEAQDWLQRLSGDALLERVITGARAASPHGLESDAGRKEILKEISNNLSGDLAGQHRDRSTWGTGALASSVTLAPGQKEEIRFTLSWYFPHHFSKWGQDMGHNYANWFPDAAEVNAHLVKEYPTHRKQTELFARTLADTSLGSPMAFGWSGQLSTAVTNTWWVKDGNYAIWEGLGCCGLSTMDVEFDASFSVVALFPELKLAQMRNMLKYQNAQGQVPHTYDGDFTHFDQSGWGRVDMNPEFVMMVYRDYLWTGDKQYLMDMWPHVVKAMQYTGSLDTNGDGLPDKNTGYQTFDQWGLRGSPSYVCSLWIGALQAAVEIALALNHRQNAAPWKQTLAKAAESFDRMLFNGQYYSLWVDGGQRDEVCMAYQIAGQWFNHLIGLPAATSRAQLETAMGSIFKYNFNPETGLRNASVPHGKRNFLILDNLQAGGVWSGIEYAFASFMMDQGRYADGVELVNAVNRRYLRAGLPWNHVECGDHYTRPMSSWATLLAATGFKPDVPRQLLTLAPSATGDFRAPWATREGFGHITRTGGTLSIACVSGHLRFKSLRVNLSAVRNGALITGKKPAQRVTREGGNSLITFDHALNVAAGETVSVS
jgi:uncharacterized protein (DUF608 family)